MSEIYSRQTDWRSTIQHKDENKLHECEVNATQAEGARYHAPLLSAATAGKGSAPVRAATLQAAQRLHGNRSVQRSIHGSSSNVAVQRMARFDGPLEEAIRLPGHGDSGSWQDPTFGPNRAGGWGDWGPWGGTNPGGHGDWGGWQDPTFGPGGGWGGGFGGGWQDPTFGPGGSYSGGSALESLSSIAGGIGGALGGAFGGLYDQGASLWNNLTGGGGGGGYGDYGSEGGGGGANWEEVGGNVW